MFSLVSVCVRLKPVPNSLWCVLVTVAKAQPNAAREVVLVWNAWPMQIKNTVQIVNMKYVLDSAENYLTTG